MLTLYLLRHAKSAWPEGVADHDRPLAKRGREAAPLIGRHMREAGYKPDYALVSTARRTRETFALVDAELSVERHAFTGAIYGAGAGQLLSLIQAAQDAPALMLIGHNPGMTDLSVALTNEQVSDEDAMRRLSIKYPTAGLAVFHFEETRWARVEAGKGRLAAFVTPRLLGGVDED